MEYMSRNTLHGNSGVTWGGREMPKGVFGGTEWGPGPWSEPEVPNLTIHVKQKPVIYLPDGREVVIKKPVGFAGHPAVPSLNRKPKG